jgi:hypothetical protein
VIDEAYNPDDPLFLVSRDLDCDLDENERGMLRETLASSAALTREAESLRKAAGLVARWAAATAAVDHTRFASDVRAQVSSETTDSASLDRLVARWASREPRVDERAFAAGVSRRIRSEARSRRLPRILLRIGAPLAAAAAIVIAVTVGLRDASMPQRVVVVSIERTPPVRAMTDTRVVVSFGRRDAVASPVDRPGPGVAFTAVGVSSSVTNYEEAPPL